MRSGEKGGDRVNVIIKKRIITVIIHPLARFDRMELMRMFATDKQVRAIFNIEGETGRTFHQVFLIFFDKKICALRYFAIKNSKKLISSDK